MAIVALSASPATLDSGGSEFVTVTNTGAVAVTVSRGPQSFTLRPNQSRTVYPEGTAVTATSSGAGQVTTLAQAAQVTQAQQVAANAAAIAGLPGTYVPQNVQGRVPVSRAASLRPSNRLLTQRYAVTRPAITANNSPGQNSILGVATYTATVTGGGTYAIGSTTMTLSSWMPAGSVLTVDSSGQQETLTVQSVSSNGSTHTYTFTTPTTKTHAVGVAVTAPKEYAVSLNGDQIAPGVFTVYGGLVYQTVANGIGPYDPTSTTWNPTFTVEFSTDAPVLAAKLTSVGGFEITCNDEIVYDSSTGAPSGGAWIQLEWTTRAERRYRFKGLGSFERVRVGRLDSVWGVTYDNRLKCATIGDSYAQGGTLGGSLGARVADIMGWLSAANAQGGTGYANNGAGGTANFVARAPSIVAANPDIVLCLGGKNDAAADIATSAPQFWSIIKAGLPKARLYATSVLNQGSYWDQLTETSGQNAAIKAAVEAAGGTYLDTRGTITGTGKVSDPKGDGNADWLADAGGTHLMARGYELYATRIAELITGTL